MQAPPLLQQGVICVGQKGVIKLITEALLERSKTGEIHHESAGIQLSGREPEGEATAVAVHKAAVTVVPPLTMAAGKALEGLAAGEPGWGRMHDELRW